MSHIWMSHVTHMNESCHTYQRVISQIWMSHDPHMHKSYHTYVSKSWHTYEWVMSQGCRPDQRHGTHMSESCHRGVDPINPTADQKHHHTYTRYMCDGVFKNTITHIWLFHMCESCLTNESVISHMKESHVSYEWVMSHIWKSHVAHMNESWHIYKWVMAHL